MTDKQSDIERTITGVLRAIFTSRKHIMSIFVILLIGFAAVGFTILILRSAWRGEMSIKDAMTMVFVTMMTAMVGAVVMGNTLINAIKDEKIAKARAETPPAPPAVQVATEGARILNAPPRIEDAPSPAPSLSTEAITDPQTPQAKDKQ